MMLIFPIQMIIPVVHPSVLVNHDQVSTNVAVEVFVGDITVTNYPLT